MEDVLVILGANQHLISARDQSFRTQSGTLKKRPIVLQSISVAETIVRSAFSSLRLFVSGTPKASAHPALDSSLPPDHTPLRTLSQGFHVAMAGDPYWE